MLIHQILPAAMCSGIDPSKKECLSFFSFWKYTHFEKMTAIYSGNHTIEIFSRNLVFDEDCLLLLNAMYWNNFYHV